MKKRSLLLILALSASAIGLTGCSNNAQTGAVIGSLVGAGIGKSTANHRDRRAGVGAVLGGLVGAAIGSEQDRKNAAYASSHNTHYSHGSNHTYHNTQQRTVARPSVSHKHGNRTHTHPGGSGKHAHNYGNGNHGTVQNTHTTSREVVYVDRPYYPVSTSIVLGTGYYNYPRRHYRHRHHYRHNKRHYRHHNRHRVRHHNRHGNRHHNKHRNRHRH